MSSCTVSLRSLFLRRSQSFSPSFRNYLLMSIVEVWSDSPKLKQSFFFFFATKHMEREKYLQAVVWVFSLWHHRKTPTLFCNLPA